MFKFMAKKKVNWKVPATRKVVFISSAPPTYKFGTVEHLLIDASEYAQVGLNYTLN